MALVVLVPLTCLAVASISVWLVVPYLLVMGAVLLPPAGRSANPAESSHSPHWAAGKRARRRARVERESASREVERASTSTGNVGETIDPEPGSKAASKPNRSRRARGRARMRDANRTGAPSSATWVRIGPGKFVRVEGVDAQPESGLASDEGSVSGLLAPHLAGFGATSARGHDQDGPNEAAAPEDDASETDRSVDRAIEARARSDGEREEDTASAIGSTQSDIEAAEFKEPSGAGAVSRGWDLDDDCDGWRDESATPADAGGMAEAPRGIEDPADHHQDDDQLEIDERWAEEARASDEVLRDEATHAASLSRVPISVAARNAYRADRYARPERGVRDRSRRAVGRPRELARAYHSRAPP
jgi:hypothetical protein